MQEEKITRNERYEEALDALLKNKEGSFEKNNKTTPRYWREDVRSSIRPSRVSTNRPLKKFCFSKLLSDASGYLCAGLVYLILAMFLANIISPIILFFIHPDMQFVIGNPKPVYFYEVSSSCSKSDDKIASALEYLSDETGVRFIRLPSPYALIIGGISYECNGTLQNHGAVGEAESGMVGASYFMFVWNKIKLLDVDRTTILHETLHVMGFDHNENKKSIMHSHAASKVVEADLLNFIRKTYVENPLVYLNLLPINLFYEVLFLSGILLFLFGIFS